MNSDSNHKIMNERVRRVYQSFAIMLTNTVILFIVANAILIPVFAVRDAQYNSSKPWISTSKAADAYFNTDGSPVPGSKRSNYQLRWFDRNAYEGVPSDYVATVLDDFYDLSSRGFMYQAWVEFSEPLFSGSLVNVDVDESGIPIRRTVNPINDRGLPTIRIFTFGGSTTFGYNVSDEHTWPSYLSKKLNQKATTENLHVHIEVVNYGRGFYGTSQETMLLIDLLKNGHRPSYVVFMDGVNWRNPREDTSRFTDTLVRRFANIQGTGNLNERAQVDWIPVVRLANAVSHRLFGDEADNTVKDVATDREPLYSLIVNRFNQNRKIARSVSELYSVQAMFFLQPNATYNYPLHLYRLELPDSFMAHRRQTDIFYTRMEEQEGIIYLGTLFDSWDANRKAIVDDVHYSPAFNEFLASYVADHIDLIGIAAPANVVDAAASSGLPRTIVTP